VNTGRHHQPRVGRDLGAARQLAGQINSQLEMGAPSALGFQPITIHELRAGWLAHHEDVRRSSIDTIRRYSSATAHLVNFIRGTMPLARASDLQSRHAEAFVRYLRTLRVAPNGHPNARQRPLRDTGVKFILETCCSLFNDAFRQRHLPPYAENPFRTIEVNRVPVEDACRAVALTADHACWWPVTSGSSPCS
jgi:hypothetical protein